MVAASQQQPVPRQRLLNKVLWAAIKCFCPLAYSQSMTGERVKRRGKRGKGERQAEPISRLPFPVILNCYRAQLGIGNTFIRICVYYLPSTCSRLPLPRPCVCCRLQLVDVWRKLFQLTWQQVKNRQNTHTRKVPRGHLVAFASPLCCLCPPALSITDSLSFSVSPSLSLSPS